MVVEDASTFYDSFAPGSDSTEISHTRQFQNIMQSLNNLVLCFLLPQSSIPASASNRLSANLIIVGL